MPQSHPQQHPGPPGSTDALPYRARSSIVDMNQPTYDHGAQPHQQPLPSPSHPPTPAAPSPQPSSSMPPPSTTKNQAAFVPKLYSMVEDTNIQHLIAWTQAGDVFSVFNPTEFSRTVLPQYFKHNNWQSFVRQLNMYGFHKVNDMFSTASSGSEMQAWEFQHPSFQRGRPDLLQNIKRKSSKANHANQSAAATSSATGSATPAPTDRRQPPTIPELATQPASRPSLPARPRGPSTTVEPPLPSPHQYRAPPDLAARRGSTASVSIVDAGYYPPIQHLAAAYSHSIPPPHSLPPSAERTLVISPRHPHPRGGSPGSGAGPPSASLVDRSGANSVQSGSFSVQQPGGPGSLVAIHRHGSTSVEGDFRLDAYGRHIAGLENQLRTLSEALYTAQQENLQGRHLSYQLFNSLIQVVAGMTDENGNLATGTGGNAEVAAQRRLELEKVHHTMAQFEKDLRRGRELAMHMPISPTYHRTTSSSSIGPLSPADPYAADSTAYPVAYARHRAEPSNTSSSGARTYYSPPNPSYLPGPNAASPPPTRSGRSYAEYEQHQSSRHSPPSTTQTGPHSARWAQYPRDEASALPPAQRLPTARSGAQQLAPAWNDRDRMNDRDRERDHFDREREQRHRDRGDPTAPTGWSRSPAVGSTPSLVNLLNNDARGQATSHREVVNVGGSSASNAGLGLRKLREDEDEEGSRMGMDGASADGSHGRGHGPGDSEGDEGEPKQKRLRR